MPLLTPCAPDLLKRCLEDALSPIEERRLEEHLSGCPVCRDHLEKLAASPEHWTRTSSRLRELEAHRPSPVRRAVPLAAPTFEFDVHDFIVDELEPAQTEGAIGRLGDVEVLEIVGHGAMGVVLKGIQPELQRLVAVKVLRPDLCGSGAARKRFLREARAAAAVVNPHVMPIHSVHSEGRLPHLIMPYLACESLQQQLDRDGPLELMDVLRIGIQVAQALDAAHAQGLVHRDVKPANVLIERDGQRALLSDFGLARAIDDASLTQTGQIAGTPQYMSPEQARGVRIDHRSDLFSLGSVLYALWTGHPPFRAETAVGVLKRLCDLTPRAMSEIRSETPDWFALLIDRLHAKSPELRLQSAKEVRALLEQCLRHLQQPSTYDLPAELRSAGEDSRPAVTRRRGQSTVQSRNPFLIPGGVVMLSLIGVMIGLMLSGAQSDSPRPPDGLAANASPSIVAPSALTQAATPPAAGEGSPLLQLAQTNQPAADGKYGSFDEAMNAGAARLALKEYSKSREPLEAAIKLAADDADRVKVYRALLAAYRQESDWKLGAGALEFIITHSQQTAERSLARTELMGFLRARGKIKEAIQRYEERLQLRPKDEAMLYILIEVYTRLQEDPRRAAVLLEQWSDLKKLGGEEMKVPDAAQLAGQYVKQKKFKEGAELYETTAARDAKLAAWHYKEAATAWLKAGDRERALAAAKASEMSEPEGRGELLEYFWHRGLADVFLGCEEFASAIPHYEQAIAKTSIEGYLKDCQTRLTEAKAKVETE